MLCACSVVRGSRWALLLLEYMRYSPLAQDKTADAHQYRRYLERRVLKPCR